MTSIETRSTQNIRNKSSSSEQNDLKKLKSKYSAKLPTLKVLFSEWSDDDLLVVLEEANGDLDLTIDRISEGHASQWGEVKTKKSKKEAQKAKAATISPHQTSSTITSYSPKPTTQPRTYNDRGNRSGKAPAPSNRARKTNPTWDNKQDSYPAEKSWDNNNNTSAIPGGGSWASIASSKQQNDTVDDSWNTTNTNDNWAAPTPVNDNMNNDDELNDDQPKTWASLLKSKSKPEAETVSDVNENDLSEPKSAADGWTTTEPAEDDLKTTLTTTTITNTASANDGWNTTNNTTVVESTTTNTTTHDGWNGDDWSNPVTEKSPVDEWSTPIDVNTNSISEPKDSQLDVQKEEKSSLASRLHNQEEPVVLPSSDIASLNVKFGSLNVDENSAEPLSEESHVTVKESISSEPVEDSTPSAPNTSNLSSSAPNAPVANGNNDPSFTQSAYLKQQEPATTAAIPTATNPVPAYSHQQQQQMQHQQHLHQHLPQQGVPQQQQPFGMDHLTSAYSSYLPNQPHTGTGFGINPMSGNLPDYSVYGTEAQRAAAMGYYDPTAFNHQSPSVTTTASPYQARDKYTQETGQNTAQGQTLPQQMYPNNLPYYQYYYMPNQYNAYQQSAYGQPFMNKSMYPNMYQHSAAGVKPTAAAAAVAAATQSPYNSPYGQQSQLYSQSMGSGGYDDLGLSEYQKSMYGSQPQLQGFLGQLNHQQPQATATQQAQSAQKASDLSARSTTVSNASQQQPAVQPQQQQPQQPQQQLHQQHPYAGGNNFFGQPQMFSYQYPQYQGHPHQPSATNRHQQQYWNQ